MFEFRFTWRLIGPGPTDGPQSSFYEWSFKFWIKFCSFNIVSMRGGCRRICCWTIGWVLSLSPIGDESIMNVYASSGHIGRIITKPVSTEGSPPRHQAGAHPQLNLTPITHTTTSTTATCSSSSSGTWKMGPIVSRLYLAKSMSPGSKAPIPNDKNNSQPTFTGAPPV